MTYTHIDDTITYMLKQPYRAASGEQITEVTIVRPKVKHSRQAARLLGPNPNSADYESALLAILCGLPPEDIEDMALLDYNALQGFFLDLVGAQTT